MLTPDDVFRANCNLAKRNKSNRVKYNTYTPRRADKNQPAIVKDFRTLGIQVTHVHGVGEGVFDLLCAFNWLVVSVEVKDGSKVPSARQFTDPQKIWNRRWTGLKAVAANTDDVCRISACMKAIVHKAAEIGLDVTILGNREEQYK